MLAKSSSSSRFASPGIELDGELEIESNSWPAESAGRVAAVLAGWLDGRTAPSNKCRALCLSPDANRQLLFLCWLPSPVVSANNTQFVVVSAATTTTTTTMTTPTTTTMLNIQVQLAEHGRLVAVNDLDGHKHAECSRATFRPNQHTHCDLLRNPNIQFNSI